MYGNQQHTWTKHFDLQLYFLQDTIGNSQITIQYLPTDQMLADILTKGLPSPNQKPGQQTRHILGLRGCVGCIYASIPSKQV